MFFNKADTGGQKDEDKPDEKLIKSKSNDYIRGKVMNSKTCQIYATCGVKALIICENEFLVLSKPLWFQKLGIKWNDLPGGRINFGEADPRHALARELQEELGVVEVNIFKPLHMASKAVQALLKYWYSKAYSRL